MTTPTPSPSSLATAREKLGDAEIALCAHSEEMVPRKVISGWFGWIYTEAALAIDAAREGRDREWRIALREAIAGGNSTPQGVAAWWEGVKIDTEQETRALVEAAEQVMSRHDRYGVDPGSPPYEALRTALANHKRPHTTPKPEVEALRRRRDG